MASKGRPDDGRSKHPLYATWRGILKRCECKSNGSYARYGARGVRVAPAWKDFWRFVADMGPKPSAAHSVDRIKGDKVYGPGKCKWSTPREQVHNSSRVRLLTRKGVTLCVADWATRLGVTPSAISHRIRKHGVAKALANEVSK